MKSVLDALQEGRLIELPETDKEKSLQLLATLIEAIPDVRSGLDFAGVVLARERLANTAIGHGWACPHGRVAGEGQLFCAIGWSPTGIDYGDLRSGEPHEKTGSAERVPSYGGSDGKPVHIAIMHYIPDSQKNTYLKEISGLARAIQKNPALGELSSARELGEVRSRLIDLLTAAVESALPDVKARMIQLEAKHAVSAFVETLPPDTLASLNLIPLSVLIVPGARPVVLSQDREIIPLIENAGDIAGPLASRAPFDRSGYRILTRSVSTFQPDRLLYDCIAVKLANGAMKK